MEKGIYFVADKDKVPLLWKNSNFFTEEEIQYYIKNGIPKEKDLPVLLPVFSEGWMALQYIKRHSLQDAQVGFIEDQEYWSYILNIAKNSNVKKIITNPCILDYGHECTLLTFELDEVSNFSDFNNTMKEFESFDGKCGYSLKELLNKN